MNQPIDRILLKEVVPNAMQHQQFNATSVWNNPITIAKENTLIIAPSGTGKTSLLGYIYGLRNDYSGTIELGTQNIRKQKLSWWSAIRQKQLGVIFQDLRLIPHLTIGENLILKNNLTKHKSIEEIKNMVASVGLADKWNQSCGTLSYGQQQRVAIVRSLLQPMDFLVADEPFSHIDDGNIEKAKELILTDCNKQNTALLLFSLGSDYGITFNTKLTL